MEQNDVLKALRDEIQAEHSLIANRMTWYVTSQSFLMTAYAVSWGNAHDLREFLGSAIPILGLVLSIIILIGIYAAVFSQLLLNQYQEQVLTKLIREAHSIQQREYAANYRRTTCIGKKCGWSIHLLGMFPPLFIPTIFIGIWFSTLCIQPLIHIYINFVIIILLLCCVLSFAVWYYVMLCWSHKMNRSPNPATDVDGGRRGGEKSHRAEVATSTSPVRGAGSAPKLIIYDTDMGTDDWMAALLLLRCPQVEVKGITVTGAGLTHLDPGITNALALVTLAGKEGIPVVGGRKDPLEGTAAFPDEWRNQADRLCGVTLTTNDHPRFSQSAPELILSLSNIAGRKLEIVATGPLTNVAEALQKDPALATRLGMIYIMGGAVDVPGNVYGYHPSNKLAEWNIFVDPHAAAVVFNSGAPVTLVPLDATNHAPVTVEFYNRLCERQSTPCAEFIFRVLTKRISLIRSGQYFFWDPLAAAIAIDERLTTIQERKIRIVEDQGSQSGQTEEVADGGVPVRVCLQADRAAFEEFFLDTLTA